MDSVSLPKALMFVRASLVVASPDGRLKQSQHEFCSSTYVALLFM
jgi:hypothetical protein